MPHLRRPDVSPFNDPGLTAGATLVPRRRRGCCSINGFLTSDGRTGSFLVYIPEPKFIGQQIRIRANVRAALGLGSKGVENLRLTQLKPYSGRVGAIPTSHPSYPAPRETVDLHREVFRRLRVP